MSARTDSRHEVMQREEASEGLKKFSVIQALTGVTTGTGKDERGLVERSLSSSREVRMPRSNKV